MKSIMCFLFLNAFLSLGQCWESLDTSTEDTSTNDYIIRKDGTLWSLPTNGIPFQMNSSKIWKTCF